MKNKSVFHGRWLRVLVIVVFAAALLVAAFWIDAPVSQWVLAHQNRSTTKFMKWVSWIGDWEGHVIVALIGLGVAYCRGSKTWMRICVALIIACALGGAAARVGKIGLGRSRPSVNAMQAWSGPKLSAKYHSFPSGHVTSSVAFFTTLLLVRRRIGLPLLIIPAIIGASRVYLLAHYFSDVIGGAIIGAACAYAVVHVGVLKIRDQKSEIRN